MDIPTGLILSAPELTLYVDASSNNSKPKLSQPPKIHNTEITGVKQGCPPKGE
jgi:hypothetical protein